MGTTAHGGKGFKGRARASGERPIGASCRQQHNLMSCRTPPAPTTRGAISCDLHGTIWCTSESGHHGDLGSLMLRVLCQAGRALGQRGGHFAVTSRKTALRLQGGGGMPAHTLMPNALRAHRSGEEYGLEDETAMRETGGMMQILINVIFAPRTVAGTPLTYGDMLSDTHGLRKMLHTVGAGV